jgi:signal transduction histidine kinase
MSTITRLIGVGFVLLVVLLAGSAAAQFWLRHETGQLKAEAISARRAQFEQVVQLAKLGPPPWSTESRQMLQDSLGVTLTADPSPGTATGMWGFDYASASAEGAPPSVVRVSFPPPQTAKLVMIYQRATVVLLLIVSTLLVGLVAVVALASRRNHQRDENRETRSPFRSDTRSLASLAKMSVEQGAQLQHERSERLRIQEDLNFQQVLLNRSLEEKIRLGHDLHDGIIQSLYATGLTLEAARASTEKNPALARQQVEQALTTLNTTIRDVRSYILGLAPESLRKQSFTDSVRSIADTLGAERSVDFDVRVDEPAAAKLTDLQFGELLQIVREGISNAVRHSSAKNITLRLHENDGELALLVQDDGQGFDVERATRGQGLRNIQARADKIDATVRWASSPGAGTRLVVTLPSTVSVSS